MFNRLEGIYLGILRAATVVVAGLALLVVLGSLFGAGPNLVRSMRGPQPISETGDLAEFMALLRQSPAASTANEFEQESARPVPRSYGVARASKAFATYLHRSTPGAQREDQFIRIFNTLRDEVDAKWRSKYDAELADLGDQLLRSRGRPLSEPRIAHLIDWHHARFVAAVENEIAAVSAARKAAENWLVRAAQGVLFFAAVSIVLLLVRIERHLAPSPSDQVSSATKSSIGRRQ
jgi:hypothetical protein